MTLQNKITQIILDGAPANTTIAQIKLMAAKLVALVDEAISSKDGAPLPDNGNLKPEQFIKVSVVPCNDWIILDEDDDDDFTPVEQPKTEERMKLNVNSDGTFSWSKVQVPISEDDDNQGLWGLSRDEVSACASAPYDATSFLEQSTSVHAKFKITEYGKGTALIEFDTSDNMWVLYGYDKLSEEYIDKLIADFTQQTGATTVYSKDLAYVWCNGKREKIAYNYNGEKITLSESVQANAVWKSTPKPSEPRPMTICYGNSMNDMFISYDNEANQWVLYNWSGVDGREQWLEEVRVRCEIWEVVSDDFKWIWRNGEREKREVS